MRSQKAYRLENFMVREFNAKKYLVMPRSDYKFEPIPDIEAVETSIGEDTPEPSCIHNVRIIAVLSLENHRTCLRCKARVEPATPPFGRCSKPACSTSQLFDACAELLSAKLMFTMASTSGQSHVVTLHASGRMLKDIMGSTSSVVTERDLLSLNEFSEIKYNDMDVITSVTHHQETTV